MSDIIPFSIFGSSPSTSGAVIGADLYVEVLSSGVDNQYLNLYTTAAASGSSINIPLYLQNDASSGLIPLYIKGLSVYDGNPYTVDNFFVSSGDMNLFIHRELSDYTNLFIQQSDGSGSLGLHIDGAISTHSLASGEDVYLETQYLWHIPATGPMSPGYMGWVGNPAFTIDDVDYLGINRESLLQAPIISGYQIQISGVGLSKSFHSTIRSVGITYNDNLLGINSGASGSFFDQHTLVNLKILRPTPIQLYTSLYISGSGHAEQQLQLYTHGF